MNKRAGDNHRGGHGEKLADADWRPSMDPDCSSPNRNRKPGPLSRLLAFRISRLRGTTRLDQAEPQRLLREMGRECMPFGQRLRELRRALGWTQRMVAIELGITVRTVIRYENSQHRTPWVRLSLLLKLRDLERVCAEEILAYLARGEREKSWLPSAQSRLGD
jgi:DNA-binding XRE family transcriptional regulator